MGLLSARKHRREARDNRIRESTYGEAIAKGKSPDEATQAAERAARRRRRRVIAAVIGGT